MPGYSTDHAGLEILPFEECLRLLASVPGVDLGITAGVEGRGDLLRGTPGAVRLIDDKPLASIKAAVLPLWRWLLD